MFIGQKFFFHIIRLEVQPQGREILRPMSQRPPFPEVMYKAMLLQISEKTSPIVEPRVKVLISSSWNPYLKTVDANHFILFSFKDPKQESVTILM